MFSPQEFWQYVDRRGPDECWLWKDTILARSGYGAFYHPIRRQTMSAHRVAWMLTHGDIPKGLEVCHRCDVAACCNPACLWLGTHTQNMRDMVAKGRRSTVAHARKGVKFSAAHRAALSLAQKQRHARRREQASFGLPPVRLRADHAGLLEQPEQLSQGE